MQCRNCSGNDFQQTKTGNYKCTYCGTLFFEEKQKVTWQIPGRKKFLIIAGLIFAALVVTTLVIISSTWNTVKKSSENPDVNNYTFINTDKLPDPKGEIISVDAMPDSIGNMYFLVMCRNSGRVAIRKPEIIIRLLSSTNEKVASGRGYAFIENLNPGEITPVYLIITKYPKYEKIETAFTPELPYIIPEDGIFKKKFTAELMEVSMKQTFSSNSHEIRGKIKNTSGHTVKFVKIAAILYDKNNKASAYGYTYISEKKLNPGNFDFFQIRIYTKNTKPEYYKLFFDGMVD